MHAAAYSRHVSPSARAGTRLSTTCLVDKRGFSSGGGASCCGSLGGGASAGGAGGGAGGVAAAAASSSASELVSALYRDRPLTYELRQAAAETVYNHLVFLRAKGEVETLDGSRGHLGSRWVCACCSSSAGPVAVT